MLGVSRGACGQWERGITVPSVMNLSKLAWHLNVYFEWLATGRGEIEYKENKQIIEKKYEGTLSSNQK